MTTSISTYGFFYILRESTRYLCISGQYSFWTLSSEETNFFNNFYASIAVITGLASSGRFLCNFPSFYSNSISNRTNILNDFRILHWLFIMWAVKIGVTFGIMFGMAQAYSEMNLYENYKYLFYLFSIVLYLHLWTNTRKVFKGLTNKYFIPVTIGFILSTFVLGSINFIDTETLNNKYLSKNPYHVLELKTPISNYSNPASKSGPSGELFFGYERNTSTNPSLFHEGEIRNLDYVEEITKKWKSRFSTHSFIGFTFYLSIDESLPMKYVKKLEEKIKECHIYKVGYVVDPVKGENLHHFNGRKQHLLIRLGPMMLDSIMPNRYNDLEKFSISFENNKIMFENKIVSTNELRKKISETIDNIPNYIFILNYEGDLSYGNYIKMYSLLKEVFSNKRNKLSFQKFNMKFDRISRDEKKEIIRRYPFIIEDEFK